MVFTFKRSYCGPIKGVILDWAGTTIDYGCFAPLTVFVEIFKKRGIDISIADARGPMGMHKRDHIAQILSLPEVQQKWEARFKQKASEKDIDDLFADFVPMQLSCLKEHAKLIPNVKETIELFRERKLKIGTTTGYMRQMMEVILPLAKSQGFIPDALVCANDVPMGRPAPWMAFSVATKLQVYPMESLVKIGDTKVDIEEGLNAGMWTIGVAKTGNEVGLTLEEFESLSKPEQEQKLAKAYQTLNEAGAHFVVDGLSDVPKILLEIEKLLKSGVKP